MSTALISSYNQLLIKVKIEKMTLGAPIFSEPLCRGMNAPLLRLNFTQMTGNRNPGAAESEQGAAGHQNDKGINFRAA